MTKAHGRSEWRELYSWTPEAAIAFYEMTLGWRFEPKPNPAGVDYWIASQGDEPVAGLFRMRSPEFDGHPDHWMTYFSVDDVDAAAEAVVDAGGSVAHGPFDMGPVGRVAIVQDAGGAVVSLVTAHAARAETTRDVARN